MNLPARTYCFLVLAALGFTSCRDIPDYPAAPQITIKEVKKTEIIFNGQPTDSIAFVINFTDGDGDLGLGTGGADVRPPYQYCQQFTVNPAGDTICNVLNPNYNNWRMKFFIKQNGEFVPSPTFEAYSGRFPRLEPEEFESGPLDGTITYFIRLEHIFFPRNTEAKFQIQILDRNFNVSNVIETDTIILNED